MLSQKEQDGIKDILQKLGTDDLFSLTFTVTKGFIKPENQHEAVQAVLLYCEKPSLLLRRKKVRKEIIFSYLRDKGVVVSVSGEKTDYIKACLHFWESPDKTQIEMAEDMSEENIELTTPSANGERFPKSEVSELPTVNPYGTYCSLDPQEVIMFGRNFVTWFYGLLNRQSMGTSREPFDEQCFVQDSCLKWLVRDAERIFSGTVTSSNQAVQVVREMVFMYRLTLDPGVEGVLSRYDPHGIMQVHVQGVVHQMDKSIGLFEQTFGLFRDVTQTNDTWKIKRTDLKMEVNVVLGRPQPLEYNNSTVY